VKPGSDDRIDVVVPVYNEAENIVRLLAAFDREVNTPIRILLCHDRGDDPTLAAAQSVHSKFEIVPVLNRGKLAAGAIATGLRFGRSPAVITFMADDDYNAGLIDRMVAEFRRGCDLVAPSRYMPGGCMQGCRWYKAFGSRAACWTLAHLARLPVHDATNAFRLFSRRLIDSVAVESTVGFTFSLELAAKCHRLGWPMCELPARWFERAEGKSRFRVFEWMPSYLRWYFYVYGTTFFRLRRI
jgi:dolichol-phosphate mannosyltransferase